MRSYPSRLAASVAALVLFASSVSSTEPVTPLTAVAPRGSSLRHNSPIVKAVKKVQPSVVTIRVPRPGGGKDLIGTGIIFDERGYIVTNRHVVGGNPKVNVRLHDNTDLVGTVLVAETRWDLAVVQIKAGRELQAMPFGPVDDLMVGETVIAVGHPFGYQNTVSTGIISALKREITMPSGDTITDLIQTDASINPGNSGGPLLNIDGELIGVNVALREGAQGIAFAINAGMVKAVLSRHLSTQRVAGVEIDLRSGQVASLEGSSPVRVSTGPGVATGAGH